MKGARPALVVNNGAMTRMPAPPEWLSERAKAEWRRVMPSLLERGYFTLADLGNLENYCIAQGRVREVEAMISGDVDLKTLASLSRVQDKAMATARQLAGELGLTPISRSRPVMRDMFEDGDDPLNVS